jgi:hypothetical protein
MGVCFIHFSSPMVLKGPCIEMFVQFLHIFGKNYSKWIIFERFSILGMADFFQIGIRDIAMTCTNIVLGQTLLKLLKLLGPTQNYKRVHDLIVWPCGFLKYALKSQGDMHLATQDAHLLNFQYFHYSYCW